MFLLMILIVPVGKLQAQSSATEKTQVANIRDLYAKAKQQIEDAKRLVKEGEPGNELTINNYYQVPGCGPNNEVISIYYNGTYSEEASTVVYIPYFISRKFNYAVRNYYQEILFDQKGDLVFFFEKMENDETRYYWSTDKLIHEIIKGDRTTDEVFAARLASDLKEAFNKIMNRNY